MDNIAEDENEDVTETMGKILKTQEKIKYQAFEKIKITNKSRGDKELKKLYESKNNIFLSQEKTKAREEEIDTIEDAIGEKLIEMQRKTVEKELEEMKNAKMKSKCGAVFKLKAKVTGEKKLEQKLLPLRIQMMATLSTKLIKSKQHH